MRPERLRLLNERFITRKRTGLPRDPSGGLLRRGILHSERDQVIRNDDLARAMVNVALAKTAGRESRIFENHDIRAMVDSFHLATG
jgi:hypothetical protein